MNQISLQAAGNQKLFITCIICDPASWFETFQTCLLFTPLRGPELNDASQENFDRYMELHLKTCENRNLLGYGVHGLIFLQKA